MLVFPVAASRSFCLFRQARLVAEQLELVAEAERDGLGTTKDDMSGDDEDDDSHTGN